MSPSKRVEDSPAAARKATATAADTGKRPAKVDGQTAVLTEIAGWPEDNRAIGERLHAIIASTAPQLVPRLWYGMPAYSKDGKVLVFFRGTQKFKERYMTLGFDDPAHLDDGNMWPIYYAITKLTSAEEARVTELIKRAVG